MSRNFRQELTQKIIVMLAEGTAPWVKPWDPSLAAPMAPINGITGRPYQGGNSLWLSCQAYTDPRWATFKAISEAGGRILKGERSSTVEYWQWTEKKRNDQGEMVEVKLETPKVYYANLFNFQQADHLPALAVEPPDWDPCEVAERILKNSGADIRYDKTDAAFYSPRSDQIHMPPKVAFPDALSHYAVAMHELSHWSGGKDDRVPRGLLEGLSLPGKEGMEFRAREELRAELSSFFLAARLGIPHDPGQHASYVKSWIQILQNDNSEIYRAAKDAERICEFVLQFQHEKTLTQVAEPEPRKPSEKAAEALAFLKKSRSKSVELEC